LEDENHRLRETLRLAQLEEVEQAANDVEHSQEPQEPLEVVVSQAPTAQATTLAINVDTAVSERSSNRFSKSQATPGARALGGFSGGSNNQQEYGNNGGGLTTSLSVGGYGRRVEEPLPYSLSVGSYGLGSGSGGSSTAATPLPRHSLPAHGALQSALDLATPSGRHLGQSQPEPSCAQRIYSSADPCNLKDKGPITLHGVGMVDNASVAAKVLLQRMQTSVMGRGRPVNHGAVPLASFQMPRPPHGTQGGYA
jgi:hypothetical protein